MQNYKDKSNVVHVLESKEFEYLLPADCVEITQSEADFIINPPLTLDQTKDAHILKIESSYNNATQENINYMGKLFQADTLSQDRLLKCLVALGGTTVPDNFYWLALDNSEVPMTFIQLQSLAVSIMLRTQDYFKKLQNLKTQIREVIDINDLKLISW